MVNKICKECVCAHIYKGTNKEKFVTCQNEDRYHLKNNKCITVKMKACRYRQVEK